MSAQIFDIHRKPNFDDSISRVEVRTYYPYVKSFENNDVIDIAVNQSDSWFLMSDSAITIKGKIDITGPGDVDLVHNAGAFFFDSVSYQICGKEMEFVRDPGRVSTLRGYLCYELNSSKSLAIAGWNFPSIPIVNSSDKSFRMVIPLKHLFGIFNDYQKVMYGKQSFRLVRARNDNDCLLIKEASSPNDVTTASKTTAKINIESIDLKVVHIVPNDSIKLELLQTIKQDPALIIPYRKWEIHELPSLKADATREIWAVKTSSAVESPRYVIVGFQTNRNGNTKTDPTQFDHINISNIRLSLNADYWPHERMILDFEKHEFSEAHKNYTTFCQSFNGMMSNFHPLLDYVAFKTHCLFVIDCSRREDSVKSSTIDIKLDIEAQKGFPADTKAFCLIIHDCMMEYHPLSEIVRNLT